MSTEQPSTVWYENVAEGTFHEVLEGSDTEKRMKREFSTRGDDDEDVEAAYRRVPKSDVPAPSKQPGYVKNGEDASPTDATVEDTRQTPTADTDKGPLVGEPGAEKQAEQEVELGGAAPGGVKPSATAAKKTAAQAAADKAK